MKPQKDAQIEVAEINEYHLVKKEEPWPAIEDRGIIGDHMIHSTNMIRMIQFLEDHPELHMPSTGENEKSQAIVYPGAHIYIHKKIHQRKKISLTFFGNQRNQYWANGLSRRRNMPERAATHTIPIGFSTKNIHMPFPNR